MRATTIVFALMASVALAGPASRPVKARQMEGVCNGSSCKVDSISWGCSTGKCTAQSGAGDGAPCGGPDYESISCPGS
ncbi:uncharacterized protein ASPGLDRAFT_36713 [Aspergillus glaucus CBS 516.65]|uniref:Uncharacterized protein n=1 Tax=Aspergillus glaucus CBS 516.65 TaxID=1160497 RepID=A0A1L9VHA9_ASPGL|nr:hypothetical protein ASPGLDRAFT_36713 [Aspergillus glaucus CBS 516.65]OJJ83273.1 hypothetical protein ASPGLDRAFT_36713 [Aspergillus glaucus CBS 516.65]